MKLSPKREWLYWVALAAVVAVFVTLAALQYRWSGEIASASSVRMHAALQTSMNGFREDLYREFSAISLTFETGTHRPFEASLSTYASRFQSWQRSATHPRLIRDVYVWRSGPAEDHLFQLSPGANAIRPAEWPDDLFVTKAAMVGIPERGRRFFPPWDGRRVRRFSCCRN